MLNIGTNPTVRNMIFTGNHASDRGGAMYNRSASPLVEGSLFEGNSSGAMGGGMFNIEGSQPTIVGSRFTANTSHKGGGMRNYLNSDAFVIDSIFSFNVAESEGGGMDNRKNSNVTVMNTMFIGNMAGSGGGAMHNYAGRAEDTGDQLFVNLLIVGNSAPSGAGIRNNDESPIMINVTVADNEGTGVSSRNGSAPKIFNSIVWGNTGGSFGGSTANQADVRYSNIEGGFWGDGNVNLDPLFENPSTNNYRLAAASQMIDAGSNIHLLPEQGEDLDGNTRIMGSAVDMGPYEYGDCANGETCGPGNLAPTASFDLVCSDLICSFMDRSEDIDGTVDTWSWSFGDGNVSVDQDPVYEFAAAGTYEVVLSVTDNEGAASLPEMQQIPVGKPASVLSIDSISPTLMGVSDSVLLVITGSGFADDAEVSLSGGSGPINVSNIVFKDPQTIEATITTKAGGPPKPRFWDVTVHSGGAGATLSEAFTVLP